MRIAADLSMALRDYEGAAGLYRLLAADYKADKAWRRLGAAQESLGHALAMTQTRGGGRRRAAAPRGSEGSGIGS